MGRLALTGRLAAALVVLMLPPPEAAAQALKELTLSGVLTAIQVDSPNDRMSAGRIVVGKTSVIVPATVSVELRGDTMTLRELFDRAPARCRAERETGLLASDGCRRPLRGPDERVWAPDDDQTPRTSFDPTPTDELPLTVAAVVASRGNGGLVATDVTLGRTDEVLSGAVTYVNEPEGYLRVNGAFGLDEGGAILRINDPDARQSVQAGAGCGEEGNCSPDIRFKVSLPAGGVRFDAGYVACIPGGLGEACAGDSRPVQTLLDGDVMLPILPGDHLVARGDFEVHGGVRVFWAHTLVVHTSP